MCSVGGIDFSSELRDSVRTVNGQLVAPSGVDALGVDITFVIRMCWEFYSRITSVYRSVLSRFDHGRKIEKFEADERNGK